MRADALHGPDAVRRQTARLLLRHGLSLILLLGLTIRLLLLITPRAYFPDEIFQYLEPAHRLVFGQGVVTWEYRYHIRSWLLPLMLAGPMALGNWVAAGSTAYLLLPKLLIVGISLLGIVGANGLGRSLSPSHGLFAAFVIAVWSESALFGTQALTEVLAVWFFLPGAALLYRRKPLPPPMLVLAGGLIALAAILRFQYAPAIGLFVLLRLGRDLHRWGWVMVGATAAMALSATIDLAMGQLPFAWIIEDVRQNIVQGRSHAWVYGPSYYPLIMMATWQFWLIPIGFLACIGARRFPALMAMAIVNIAIHTLIAHKEYRYIILSTMLILLLAAIGTVDMIHAARKRKQTGSLMPIAVAGWIVASVMTALTPAVAGPWAANSQNLEAFASLREEPGLCGLAIHVFHWSETGGYTYLHRAVPLYVPQNSAELRSTSAGFNVILAPPDGQDIPASFRKERCFGLNGGPFTDAACLYRRSGSCDPRSAAPVEINRYLRRVDL